MLAVYEQFHQLSLLTIAFLKYFFRLKLTQCSDYRTLFLPQIVNSPAFNPLQCLHTNTFISSLFLTIGAFLKYCFCLNLSPYYASYTFYLPQIGNTVLHLNHFHHHPCTNTFFSYFYFPTFYVFVNLSASSFLSSIINSLNLSGILPKCKTCLLWFSLSNVGWFLAV